MNEISSMFDIGKKDKLPLEVSNTQLKHTADDKSSWEEFLFRVKFICSNKTSF